MDGENSIATPIDDQILRWENDDRVSVETLIENHSIQSDQVVADLIYNEVLLREKHGEHPVLADYSDRFPHLEEMLVRQFQIHHALQETDAGGETPTEAGGAFLSEQISISGFELQHIIGRGGSAVAWRAKDLKLDRTVAIKLLSRASIAGESQRDQLLKEARAAAALRHPSIVQVHQIGQSEGVPFLVMEFISGGSLAQKLVDGPMLPERVAKIGVAIAQAVSHAHENGVIHRDLKPENILLDENESPYVADFGLAKQLDPEETRQSTRVIGTPAYMSPEQARGQSESESVDIYSLGATLYEMLTGRPPFQSAAVWDTLYQVMENNAVPARQLNDRVPRDLETICAKCLDKRPDRRYESASNLAADLQRFLDGKPIVARPVSGFETFRRWCLRNRALAGSLLVVAGLLAALAVGGVLSALHFQKQNEKLSVAVRNSIDAADELLISVTEDAQLLPKSPGSQQISRRLLERARGYFTSFIQENDGDPDLAFQLARTHAGLARVASAFEDSETLELETNAAISLLEEIELNGVTFETQALRGQLQLVYGRALEGELKSDEAIDSLQLAVTAFESAAEMRKDDQDAELLLAKSKSDLGAALRTAGNNAKAQSSMVESLEILNRILETNPNLTDAIITASKVESNLANIVRPESQELFDSHLERAIDLLDSLPKEERGSVVFRKTYATCHANKGIALSHKGKVTEANEAFQVAINEAQRLVELEPSINSHKRLYTVAVLNSGYVDMFSDDYQRMADRIQAVLPVANKLVDAAPDNMSNAELKLMLLGNLAVALRALERYEEALEAVDQSVEAGKLVALATGTPESNETVALSHYQRGQILIGLDRIDEAIAAVEASRKASNEALKIDPEYLGSIIHLLDLYVLEIEALSENKPRPTETIIALAEKGLEEAIAARAKHSDIYLDMSFASLLSILGDEHLEIGKPSVALEFASQIIDEFQPKDGTPEQSEVSELNDTLIDAHLLAAKALQNRKGSSDAKDSDEQRVKKALDAAKALGATGDQLSITDK